MLLKEKRLTGSRLLGQSNVSIANLVHQVGAAGEAGSRELATVLRTDPHLFAVRLYINCRYEPGLQKSLQGSFGPLRPPAERRAAGGTARNGPGGVGRESRPANPDRPFLQTRCTRCAPR